MQVNMPAARRLAQLPENYADGGAVGFGARGLSQLRELVPKMAAMGFPQQAKAPAPAPVSDPRAAQLMAMIPKMEAMGYKQQPQMLARGGMVRGPGTGTSDSIPDEMEPGTYIMPADSTKQLGLDDKKVPVRVSNGEYELPPEQVQAVGAAVLDAIKGVTHTPKSLSARGLQSPQDEQFFATGGSVRDPEELRKMIPQVEAMGYAQSPAAAPAPVAAPVANIQTGQPRSVSPSTLYMQDRAQERKDQVGQGNYAQAAGTAVRTVVQGLGMHGVELADKAGTPLINAARGFGSGLLGSDANAAPATPSTIASPPTSQTNPAAAPASTSLANAGRGVVNPPTVNPSAPAPSNAPAAAPEVMPGVYRHGRGQYSDNAAGMGMPAGFTGRPNAQNMAAADAMAGRSQQESMSRVMAQGFPGARGGPGSGPVEPGSFTGGYSGVVGSTSTYGNMRGRSPEQRLRDAEVSASSIMNRPKWGGRGAENSAAMLEYRAALQQDRDIRQNQAGADIEAQRQAAGIQREGMQQEGATTRTGMTEQGSNARESGRNILARDEFNLRKEASGFQTRAAQRLENLQNSHQSAKTPEERAAIAQQLRELQTKDAPARYKVAAGGQQIDANGVAYRTPDRIFNEQTGVFSDGAGAAPAPQALPPKEQLKAGQTYQTPRGPARWDGKQFTTI